jgi:ABC-type glycerol-3-phosphate transport system permease component
MKIKDSFGDRVFNGIIYVVLAVLVLIVIYPLWLVVINSFSDSNAVSLGKVTLLPVGFNLDAYVKTFTYDNVLSGYLNSLFYTVVGTLLSLLFTIPVAYTLSKRNLKGRGFMMGVFTLVMYFSGGLIPEYINIRSLGLVNTREVVLLVGALSVYNMIVARSFFESGVPHELEEAAEIDGCNQLQTFIRIVLPLSKAMLGVITLYYAVAKWNSFTPSLYYQPMAPQFHSLQMVLRDLIIRAQNSVTMQGEDAVYYAELLNKIKYSVIVVASVPMLVIFPFVQKYFDKGVMLGSVKG